MKTTDKYELLTTIAMLCDELEAYEREEGRAKGEIETLVQANEDGLSEVDLRMLGVGKKKVFEECTYAYYSYRSQVEVNRDDETGAIKVTSFERFRDSTFSKAPDFMSKDEFFAYFDAEFHDAYRKAKAEALKQYEEEA